MSSANHAYSFNILYWCLPSSTNEKLDRANFIEGVSYSFLVRPRCQELNASLAQSKLLGTYLYEVGALNA